jgi:hypothetical protein
VPTGRARRPSCPVGCTGVNLWLSGKRKSVASDITSISRCTCTLFACASFRPQLTSANRRFAASDCWLSSIPGVPTGDLRGNQGFARSSQLQCWGTLYEVVGFLLPSVDVSAGVNIKIMLRD